MKVLAIFVVSLLIILTLSACQATPEEPPVIGKTGDYLDAVCETPFMPYEAPSGIQESEVISGLNLKIDAQVIVPAADGYSVIEVSKESFGVDTIKEVMNYFRPGEPWFKEPAFTKEELIERIAYVQTNADTEDPEIKQHLEELQGLLEEAPEEPEYEPFSFEDIGENNMFYAYCRNQDETCSILAGQLNGNDYGYGRDSDGYWLREENAETDQEKNDFINMEPSISLEKAQIQAEQAMQNLNADPGMLLSYHTKSIFYKDEMAVKAGWAFCYTRGCNGLQASFVGGWDIWKGSPDPVNMAPWGQEAIFITVDDKGIASYYTSGAGKQESVLFNNVKLMAFEDILERIKQQLVYNHAYQPESIEEYSVAVNEIKLGSSLVNIKDRPNFGRLIPSWDVVYDFYERFTGEEEATVYHCHTYLNAIDGSYIEPRADANSFG